MPKNKDSCLSCSYKSENEEEYLTHAKIHEHESNFRITCFLCPQKFKTLFIYKRHRKSCKSTASTDSSSQTQNIPSEEFSENKETFWQCKNCDEKVQITSVANSSNFNAVKKHCLLHAKNEAVICPVILCGLAYQKYQSFVNHISRHNRREEFGVQATTLINSALAFDESVENLSTSFNDFEQGDDIDNFPDIGDQTFLPSSSHPPQEIVVTEASLNANIEKIEALFALKLTSKHLLSREVVNEVMSFCQNIHETKMSLITHHLKKSLIDENNLKIENVTDTIDFLDSVIGLKEQLSTHYKREKALKHKFSFIEPERVSIGKIRNQPSFYYYMPVAKTLARLLKDKTLRKHIINSPVFQSSKEKKVYRTFSDGELLRKMNITGILWCF